MVALRDRYSFGNLREIESPPNLIEVQINSYQQFLDEGLKQVFEDISPIKDFSGNLELTLEYDPRDKSLMGEPKFTEDECRSREYNYAVPFFVRARLENKTTNVIMESPSQEMTDLPLMTEKGTFIINGAERVVVSDLARSPGVIFEPGSRFQKKVKQKRYMVTQGSSELVIGTIYPSRGKWFEVDVRQRPDGTPYAGVRIDRKRRFSVFLLLRALGYDEQSHPGFLEKFVDHFDFLKVQWDKDKESIKTEDMTMQDAALLDIHRRISDPPHNLEAATAYMEDAFFGNKYDISRLGRRKLNRKIGEELDKLEELFGIELERPAKEQTFLCRSEVLAVCTYALHLAAEDHGYHLDDQDHFANRRMLTVGELMQERVRLGLSRMSKVIRERMTTLDEESLNPKMLINSRPLAASLREFFAGSPYSQFMEQVNPLAGLIHRRRMAALGRNLGWAVSGVRDVHFSHYGRMCPIETPEGPNAGLIGALATHARVNKYGFIETPYRVAKNGKVTDEIKYLEADEEEKYIIAQANAPLNKDGTFKNPRVLARRSPQAVSLGEIKRQYEEEAFFATTIEITFTPAEQVQLMDISPKQMVSVSTTLIPFLEHDDATRALMGANMQRQAVPLIQPEAPFVGTGMEKHVAHDSTEVLLAEGRGVVRHVEAASITVEYESSIGKKTYELAKFNRSNQNTCVNQKPTVKVGERVSAGDLLADGPATDMGELALGKNLLVAYMSWEGYNFEDAIIISDRLVKDDVLTSVHIQRYEVEAKDTKLGSEEITRDIPGLSEEILANLDEEGVVVVGSEVGADDILVGRVTPKGETELTAEERLLRAIFGEKAREVKDNSLKVPKGDKGGRVIKVEVLNQSGDKDLSPGVNQKVRVYVAQRRKISVGDKLSGRHGNKGVISRILPVEDMPYLPDGTPVDIILNPLGVPSRMNVGQVLEAHLGYGARWGWETAKSKFKAPKEKQVIRKTQTSIEPVVSVSTPVFDGAVWDEEEKALNHPTIKEILSNLNPETPSGERLINSNGKTTLYNGHNGEPFDKEIMVGYAYILKLNHLIDDKLHARSTGPYSMITQQPLGGKAQFGGQRLGEMEVWALEAYGASYCLQELLTYKSDDVSGRFKVYDAIVKGGNIENPGVPESFKVLVKELQALCLNVEMLTTEGEAVELADTFEEEIYDMRKAWGGINISGYEKGFQRDEEEKVADPSVA